MLSTKVRNEPDLYAMANGHVTTMNDANEIRSTSSMQHSVQPMPDYSTAKSPTSILCEYATVEVSPEYMSDYPMPMRVDGPIESSSNLGSNTCLAGHGSGSTDHPEKNIVVTQRNVSYHNHPPGVSVTVDANGFITNGNMRVPPEGMEASCKMLPQWCRPIFGCSVATRRSEPL